MAIDEYQSGLNLINEKRRFIKNRYLNVVESELTLFSNMSICYMKMLKYEDSLEYCNKALEIDEEHEKSLFRKAKCLAYLYRFDESISFFQMTKYKNQLQFVNSLR